MEEQIKQIEEISVQEISKATDARELNDLKVKYLGKKGELTQVLRGMKDLSPEQRPVIGALVNTVRDNLEKIIAEKEKEFEEKELQKKMNKEKMN